MVSHISDSNGKLEAIANFVTVLVWGVQTANPVFQEVSLNPSSPHYMEPCTHTHNPVYMFVDTKEKCD